jgi:hypothetical protein
LHLRIKGIPVILQVKKESLESDLDKESAMIIIEMAI